MPGAQLLVSGESTGALAAEPRRPGRAAVREPDGGGGVAPRGAMGYRCAVTRSVPVTSSAARRSSPGLRLRPEAIRARSGARNRQGVDRAGEIRKRDDDGVDAESVRAASARRKLAAVAATTALRRKIRGGETANRGQPRRPGRPGFRHRGLEPVPSSRCRAVRPGRRRRALCRAWRWPGETRHGPASPRRVLALDVEFAILGAVIEYHHAMWSGGMLVAMGIGQ